MGFQIIVGGRAGFCWGVKRAIDGAIGKRRKAGRPIFVFGHLVHNETVVSDLFTVGLTVLSSLEEARRQAAGEVILITAHGLDPAIRQELETIAGEVVDMTCPIVKNVHQASLDLKAEGRKMIVVGAPRDHQEVLGILGILEGKAFLMQSMRDVYYIPYGKFDQIGVVSQTTFNELELRRILERIKEGYPNTEYRSYPSIVNPESSSTICDDISLKQAELREACTECNRVVVIGSKTSANSKHLAEISEWELHKPTRFVLGANELDQTFFTGAVKVFVTAGASTPPSSIREVLEKLRSWGGQILDN
ncbi:MAG: 4-hydroxy-3-methylbut-2-enyl diphosphate reductase [Parcubacteria group bacterium Gr01-1014_20]|nr:MAG: 4-hydroxy-3-methylbut-2-enyl diphosphate reductase [Parcubacteria group bacterium Gr01-1014_20]